MRIFFDTEFTGLHQGTTLISIGCMSENGHTFYAELNDYTGYPDKVDPWIAENVLVHLRFGHEFSSTPRIDLDHHAMKADRAQVASALCEWLEQWDLVVMWSDCLAYDWVLFCDLWGGAMEIPKNIFYIPMDLSTYLFAKGGDPDANREELSGIVGTKHNALHDAKAIRECVRRIEMPQIAPKGGA